MFIACRDSRLAATNSRITNDQSCRRCCPTSFAAFSGNSVRGRPVRRSRNGMVRRPPATMASSTGGKPGFGDWLLEAVSEAYDGDIVMIDSTCVCVHQHAATEKGTEIIAAWDFPAGDLRTNSRAGRRRRSPVAPRMTGGQIADCARRRADGRARRRTHPAGRRVVRQQCHSGQGGRAKGLGQHPAEDKP